VDADLSLEVTAPSLSVLAVTMALRCVTY